MIPKGNMELTEHIHSLEEQYVQLYIWVSQKIIVLVLG